MEIKPRQVFSYVDSRGQRPFDIWLEGLKDKAAHAAIQRRMRRLSQGNFGDCKRFGVITELRVDFGPGYRVYLGQDGPVLVILLIGGDKSTQSRDILKAKEYWNEYQTRKNQNQ